MTRSEGKGNTAGLQPTEKDVGIFQPILLTIKNKLIESNVAIGFTISAENLKYRTNKWGKWNLGQHLKNLQRQDGGDIEVQLQLTPDKWGDAWDGEDPSSWGESIPEEEIPEEMYRPVTITINMQNNELRSVSASDPRDSVVLKNNREILVFLQPIWIKSRNFSKRRKEDPTLIVVHQTGGSKISGAIHRFLGEEQKKDGEGREEGELKRASAHYIIDVDGQIVKMVMNSKCAWHADGTIGSYWNGREHVNEFSIGIEMVHADEQGSFTDEQYKALISLIEKLRKRYDRIPAWGIVGHSDVQRPPTHQCPGQYFDWKKLEDGGLGLKPDPDYKSNLEEDEFPMVKGKRISDDLIEGLKADLRKIGYFLPEEEKGYGSEMVTAINRFKRHFSAGSRRPKDKDGNLIEWNKATNGNMIDFETALMIKAVRSYIDKQTQSP